MKFKTVDDISRDRENREKEEYKEGIAQDIDDVITKVEGKFRSRRKKQRRSFLSTILWILFFLLILVVFVNFILLNVWALRFFIRSLFGF